MTPAELVADHWEKRASKASKILPAAAGVGAALGTVALGQVPFPRHLERWPRVHGALTGLAAGAAGAGAYKGTEALQSAAQKAYKQHFKGTLRSHGVNPENIRGADPKARKKAFEAVDKGWKGEKEAHVREVYEEAMGDLEKEGGVQAVTQGVRRGGAWLRGQGLKLMAGAGESGVKKQIGKGVATAGRLIQKNPGVAAAGAGAGAAGTAGLAAGLMTRRRDR